MDEGEHTHIWSKEQAYWMSQLELGGTMYSLFEIEDSTSVWVKECLVCHIITHRTRIVRRHRGTKIKDRMD